MKMRIPVRKLLPIYIFVLVGCICTAQFGSQVLTTIVETSPLPDRRIIVIDAGHGGIDGGATSCTGVLESQINLEIALRLNDLLRFMGHETKMIRTDDSSIYTEGNTIAAQKVSDLKQRVRIVNETDNSILVSIHQNTFPEGKYSGAQVFYAEDEASRTLAQDLQNSLIQTVNPGSNRKCKNSDGIYLMQNITKPGVLIECGFLTNPKEEALLRNEGYQKKLVCVISACLSRHKIE